MQGLAFGGTCLEIVANCKIVYITAFDDGPGGQMNLQAAGTMTKATTFVEVMGKTTVSDITLFATIAMKKEYLGAGVGQPPIMRHVLASLGVFAALSMGRTGRAPGQLGNHDRGRRRDSLASAAHIFAKGLSCVCTADLTRPRLYTTYCPHIGG